MNYPFVTPIQLRAILRALRHASGLSQAQVGQLLGVNQQRIAKIENKPSVISVGQMARLVAALGGRLVVEYTDTQRPAAAKTTKTGRKRKTATLTTDRSRGNW
jgi:HTH-type transcriptional regulator/antitoxin HipB